MATVIQFKRSATQNAVPGTGDLSLGELAVNTYHGRFYTEKNDGSAAVVELGSNPTSLTINDAYSFPTSDGSANQVLKTDGSGTLSFANAGNVYSTFTYTVTSNQTVFTGNDDNNNSLSYTSGGENVYLNGVKLIGGGTDYTTTNSTTITLTENAVSGDTLVINNISNTSDLVEGNRRESSFTATTSDQVLQQVATSIKSIRFFVTATHASAGTHSCDVIIANDGTNAYYSQFGDVHTGNSLFTLSADVNSGNMRLLVTPANTNTTIDTFQIRHS